MQDHPQSPGSPDSSTNAPAKPKVTASGVVAAVVMLIAFLITMILLKGSDIGSPATPQCALIAANERLLQMVQWTVGTVLTLGGALIGLNWYQGEKRYEHDRRVFEEKLTAEVDRRLSEYNAHLDMVTRASIVSLDSIAAQMVREAAGPRDGTLNDLTFVHRVIRAFQSESITWMRRGIGQVLSEELVRAVGAIPGNVGRLDQDQLRRIEEIARELVKDAPDKAMGLDAAMKAYTSWHHSSQSTASSDNVPIR